MARGVAGRRGRRRTPRRPPFWRRPLFAGAAAVPVGLLTAAGLLFGPPAEQDLSDQPLNAEGPLSEEALTTEEFFAQSTGTSPSEPSGAAPPESEEGPEAASTAAAEAAGEDEAEDAEAEEESAGGSDSGSGSGGSGSGSGGGALTEQVVALVNEERAANGCGDLRVDGDLTSAAQAHSEDMAARDYMAHESPDGVSPADRAQQHGYGAFGGENVAAGQSSPEQVMDAWMNSEGHRRNILNCDFEAIGVGEQDRRWTQKFGFE